MGNKDENLAGNAALIFLFLLGFPLLDMEEVQADEPGRQETQEEVQEMNIRSFSNNYQSVDVGGYVYRLWTALAPQDFSLMLRVDLTKRIVSLSLRNDGGNSQFIWQDWVDSAMGYMKGLEETDIGNCGYGRKIVRADLRKPIVEISPLRVNEDGIEPEVQETTTARVWMGWLPFHEGICKFELDQWLALAMSP